MIRFANLEDLRLVAKLEKELFPDDPWNFEALSSEVKNNPFSNLYVIEKNDQIVGYLDFWITFEQAQIANIGVSRKVQRQGFGSSLMELALRLAIENDCENVSLEVRKTNLSAIALYEKYGFTKVAVRRHYYENGEDAWLMVKPLGGINNDDVISD